MVRMEKVATGCPSRHRYEYRYWGEYNIPSLRYNSTVTLEYHVGVGSNVGLMYIEYLALPLP